MMGQTIGMRIQLPVCELLAFTHDRNRIAMCSDNFLKNLRDSHFARVDCKRTVPRCDTFCESIRSGRCCGSRILRLTLHLTRWPFAERLPIWSTIVFLSRQKDARQ